MAGPSRRRRVVILVLGLPVLALAVMMTVGLFLPRGHSAASRAVYAVPPDSVWAAVSDFEHAAWWRPDVQRVEPLPETEGRPAWNEVGPAAGIPYTLVASEPSSLLVTRIAGEELPFSGTWIYRIAPEGAETALTIQEEGEIGNPLYRFVARFLFGHHSALDGYLTALGARYHETVSPEHVPPGPLPAAALPAAALAPPTRPAPDRAGPAGRIAWPGSCNSRRGAPPPRLPRRRMPPVDRIVPLLAPEPPNRSALYRLRDPERLLRLTESRLVEKGLAPSTRRLYLARVRHLVSRIRRSPGEITPLDLRRYLEDLVRERRPGPGTLAQVLSTLRFYFREVVHRPDLSEQLPGRVAGCLPPAPVLPRVAVLAMLGSAGSERDRLLIGLLYGSGLRLTEARALRARDLQPAGARIQVAARGRRPARTTVLSPRMRFLVERRLRECVAETPLLSGGAGGGLGRKPGEQAVSRAAVAAGLPPGVRPRDLRRAFAAHLEADGIPPRVVDRLLGRGPERGGREPLPDWVRSPL